MNTGRPGVVDERIACAVWKTQCCHEANRSHVSSVGYTQRRACLRKAGGRSIRRGKCRGGGGGAGLLPRASGALGVALIGLESGKRRRQIGCRPHACVAVWVPGNDVLVGKVAGHQAAVRGIGPPGGVVGDYESVASPICNGPGSRGNIQTGAKVMAIDVLTGDLPRKRRAARQGVRCALKIPEPKSAKSDDRSQRVAVQAKVGATLL